MKENNQQPLNSERSQTIKQMVSLRIDEIRAKSSQSRQQFSELEALARSIVREGQIQPIVVSPKNSEGYYVIQQGERRWRACQLAGIDWIEAIISSPRQDELDEVAGELIENIQREALTPLEIAQALQRFVQQGWRQKEIADRLGKNSSFVSTHLSLLKMADCIAALYQANVTHDIETLNNLRQLYDREPVEAQRICQVALAEGITRQQSREWLNASKKRVGKAVSRSKIADQAGAESATEMGLIEEIATLAAGEPMAEPIVAEVAVIPEEESPAGDPLAVGSEEMAANPQDSAPMLTDRQPPSQPEAPAQCEPGGPALSEPREFSWHSVAAEKLRITINILSEADFQQGVLVLDRVDRQADYAWAEISQGGQSKLVRVPLADIELVRIEG